jgi:hypothetical protein
VNRGTLPIVSRLQSLRTPARFAAGGGRVIASARDRNPLTQLLRTANETVLGRSLQFDSASGSRLTFEVAGRRVLRLAAVEGLDGADDCLAAEALDDEHKDQLIKLMQALAIPGYELSVTSGAMIRGGATVSVGLPVALLADLLLLDLNEIASDDSLMPEARQTFVEAPVVPDATPLAEPVARETPVPTDVRLGLFASGIGPVLMAWLIVGGEDDGTSNGPEEMVAHLQGFLGDEAQALSHQLDLVLDAKGGPICIVLGATLVEGHSVICARSGGGMLLGLIDGDGTQLMLKAWNAARI